MADTDAHRGCRLAWTELFMFPRTCLGVLPGGRAKQRRNHNLAANRLERWGLGECRELWDEAVRGRQHKGPSSADPEQQQVEAAVQLARRGLPGKALQRLSGGKVAEPTPAVVGAMRSKFPPRPPHQAASARPPPPPANEAAAEDVLRAVRSFPRGAAPGPSGLRPDFLQQLVGGGGDERPAVQLLTSLVNLLSDGRAPSGLRPDLGVARGTALRKVSKSGHPDVRPLCAGEALRRLVGKVLLRSELPALRAHLLPHQLAVGVSCGAETMPHLQQQHSGDPDRVCLSYDEGNAHNAVDRRAFLSRMREVVPGLSRWLEFIYPSNTAAKVFFHDTIIDSVAGGQQGCCWNHLGWCSHLWGVASRCLCCHRQRGWTWHPALQTTAILCGPSAEVLRCLVHWQAVLPNVGLRAP